MQVEKEGIIKALQGELQETTLLLTNTQMELRVRDCVTLSIRCGFHVISSPSRLPLLPSGSLALLSLLNLSYLFCFSSCRLFSFLSSSLLSLLSPAAHSPLVPIPYLPLHVPPQEKQVLVERWEREKQASIRSQMDVMAAAQKELEAQLSAARLERAQAEEVCICLISC